MAGDRPFIQVTDVSFDYKIQKDESFPVLKGIDLNVSRGEYVAIVGPNGSGKSTLARHLNGLLIPDRGEVRVNGWSTKDRRMLPKIREQVGMVFQNPDNQVIATTVEDDVAFGLENLAVPKREMDRRIDAALKLVGLESMRKRAPHHLSGGQKQRLAIAGMIAMRPSCLVLDEATSMLDERGRSAVLHVLRRLNGEGMAIITVTHSMKEAAEAGRVLVLDDGRAVLDGTPREIFQQDARLRQIGLDVPVSRRLAKKVHAAFRPFRGDLICPEEIVEEVRRLAGTEAHP